MSNNKNTSALSLNWTNRNDALTEAKLQDCIKRTDWTAICKIASLARNSRRCTARPEYTYGGSSLARLLEFDDGTFWIARIQLARSTSQTSYRAQIDVDTMAFLRNCTKTPVPQVFASKTDDQNSTGVAFLLLEFFSGNTAYDESRLYNNGANIPHQFQETFYSSTAMAHV